MHCCLLKLTPSDDAQFRLKPRNERPCGWLGLDGYGESLLDYDHRNKRIGIGIGLNDYLDTGNDG
ncbi:MAG: phospholipase A [Gammaproteobacteria bacterium]